MNHVNKSIVKLDAESLITGQPVYTQDIAPKECLVVKVIRSPHAFAKIIHIEKGIAEKIKGITCILTHEDMPKIRFTMAGQSYPEPSPYDRYILEDTVRYVGDVCVIVAGETETAVNLAMKAVKIAYEPLEPVLNMEEAVDHSTVIHPEDDYFLNWDTGNQVKRNICASGSEEIAGNVETEFAKCDFSSEMEVHVKANNQAMMETFRTFTYFGEENRLVVVSSTQVPFHVRRTTARALGMSEEQVRVEKPRIGGGFGAKQTLVSELFPAIVTVKTGKPAMMIFDRKESFIGATSRHEMKVKAKVGVDQQGNIKAMHVSTLSNTGAYGEHGSTTVGLSGHKTMPLYNHANAYKFDYKVVYTNTMSAGAFRGYGATQGCFAVESVINDLAAKLNIDPVAFRLQNMLKVGEVMPAYYGETLTSCALEQCLQKGKEMIGWDEKYPRKRVSETKVRAVGVAVTMQGSGVSSVDEANAKMVRHKGGTYTLLIGATDMGTGCDTILAQMAADTLGCEMDCIKVASLNTDDAPFDTGSYASSTTYVTGTAVIAACEDMKKKIADLGENLDKEEMPDLEAKAYNMSPVSPPPFMAGFAEIQLDIKTGQLELLDYVGVVDCGTPINPNLARVQTEGGVMQGIGMALYEDIKYDAQGRMMNSSFMQYKIPSRLDVKKVRIAFESSYEPSGPFGAKSIGEVVINTPAPAIAHAIFNATGKWITQLPMTPDKILKALEQKELGYANIGY